MTEEVTEGSSESESLSPAARLEQAGELLLASVGGDEDSETEEPVVASAEAKENEQAEEKPDDKPKGDPPSWLWKKVRGKEEAAKVATQAAAKTQAEAQHLKKELQQLAKDMADDPVKAIKTLAARSGTDPDLIYQKLTRGKLAEGTDSPEMREIRRLKASLAKKDRDEIQQTKDDKSARAVAQRENFVDSLVQRGVMIPDSPEHAEKYPNLASLDKRDIADMVRRGVNWAIKNKPDLEFPQLLGSLEDLAKDKNEATLKRLGARRNSDSVKGPQAKGTSIGSGQKGLPASSGVSSSPPPDADIGMSRTERIAAAAKLF